MEVLDNAQSNKTPIFMFTRGISSPCNIDHYTTKQNQGSSMVDNQQQQALSIQDS